MSDKLLFLSEAREWLRERLDDGAKCPCCTQFAKVYRRKINSRQAQALIIVWRKAGNDWCHVPTADARLAGDGGMLALLRYWGLVEESTQSRGDGGRAGWWRITNLGASFVRGHTTVAKYARIYNGRCLALDDTETVSIYDALGTKFSYDDLMAGI